MDFGEIEKTHLSAEDILLGIPVGLNKLGENKILSRTEQSQDWLLLKDLGFVQIAEDSVIKRKLDGSLITTIDHQVEVGTGLSESLQRLRNKK